MSDLLVHQFPCGRDNYGFLLHDPASQRTICVDTPDPIEIAAQAEAKNWPISEIWNTHWHADHAGGNEALQKRYGCLILAPSEVRDKGKAPADTLLQGGETLQFGAYRVEVHATPGHTLGHIIYHLPEAKLAFVGDTLFSLGCGRMFEGTPEQMWKSLKRIRALPSETQFYCAHEYTLANAAFALSVDADNLALVEHAKRVEALREQGQASVPGLLSLERASNPFLRADDAGLQRAMGTPNDAVATFAALRRRKDQF